MKKKKKPHAPSLRLGNSEQEEEVLALEAIYAEDFEHHKDGTADLIGCNVRRASNHKELQLMLV